MTPEQVRACFTRKDGQFLCARWGRPIAPVVFGVTDDTLRIVKGAVEAVVTLAGHKMAEIDPELGANLMMFFFTDWADLAKVPNLDRLIPDLGPLCARLDAACANQYRIFRFDSDGAIRAAFVFVRLDAHLQAIPAEALALAQAAETIVLWSDTAFAKVGPLGQLDNGTLVLRPDIARLIRAVYDPVLPAVAGDPSHALRLAARMERMH